MENDILQRIEAQDKKLDAIYISVEKMRKYFLITMYVTIAAIILPLIGLVIAVPMLLGTLKNYSGF